MKKGYALIFSFSVLGLSFGQTIKKQLSSVPAKKVATEELRSTNVGEFSYDKVGEFWTDNFSTAANWTIDNSGVTDPGFGWDIAATENSWYFNSIINSTSDGNFAELSNGNASTGTQALDVIYTLTTAQPIDVGTLAGTNLIKLSFLQYGARFNDLQEMWISEDGTSFVKVGDNNDIPVLSASGGAAYTNPTLKEINLGEFLSTSPTQLWIRFSWTTNYPNSATNPNVWVTYGWMIDDVSLSTYPQYDLGINKLYWGTTGPWGTIPVYQMPQAQIAPIEFAAAIENKGSMIQNGVTFEVTDGTYVGSSAVDTLTILGRDTVDVLNPFTPPTLDASYTFNFSLNSDSTDINMSDNTLPSETVEVNQFIYAVDNNIQENYYGNQGEPFETGNVFNIFTNQTLRSLLVNVNDGSVVGGQIYIKLYEIDPNATTFGSAFMEVFQNQSFYTITSADLGNWVQIPFEAPQDLEGGKSYAVVVGTYGDGTTNDVFLCNAGGKTEPGNSVLYDLNLDTWYYTNESQMVRMDFSIPPPFITSTEPDFTGCVGQPVILSSSYTTGNQWSLDGNIISGETGQTLSVLSAGSYTVTSGGFTSNPVSLTFNPVPSVVYTQVFSDVCDHNADVPLTPGNPTTGTFSGTGVTGSVFDPSQAPGTYTITYSVTQNGCTGSASSSIVVLPCLGLNENGNEMVSIYPNPTIGQITVTSTNVNDFETVKLTDQLGRIIGSWKFNSISITLDLQNVEAGNYNLVFEGEKTITKQIQVLH